MINTMIMKKLMKKLMYIGLGFVIAGLYGCANDDEALRQSDEKTAATTTRADLISCTVENLVAGELETCLPELVEDVSAVQSLVITGEFSKNDADYIKNNVTGLIVLDLTGVTQFKYNEWCYEDVDDGWGWAYRLKDSDALESNFFNRCPAEEIDLPESIIKSIGSSAFCNCKNLLSISIPSSVTSVGSELFYGCEKLKSVLSLGSITELPNKMFYGCNELTDIVIPENITSIGSDCFYDSYALKEIKIPDTVTSMGTSVFYNCSSLESFEWPSQVTSIPYNTFYGCTSLKKMEIPATVTSIGRYAFYGCALENVTIPSSVTSMESWIFQRNSKLKSIDIQASVTQIPEDFCYDCTALTEVTLSDSIKSVGSSAFYNTALSDFTPFENLNYDTGTGQFSNCLFESVDLSHINKIPGDMFYECTKLTEVSLSDSLKSIGDGAFGNTGLSAIELPNSLTEIGSYAFGKTNLSVLTVPKSVTSIGSSFLSYCPNLVGVFWKSSAEVPGISYDYQWHTFLYLTTNADGTVPTYDNCWGGMVIVDGVGDSIVLKSGCNPYACPQTFTAKKIYYSTNFNGTYSYWGQWSNQTGYGYSKGWQTIALPFSPSRITHPDVGLLAPFGSDTEEDFKPFWLRDLTADGFVNVTKIEANRPYIISMPYNPSIYLDEYNIQGTVTFEAENVEIQASEIGEKFEGVEGPGYTFYPSYSYQKKAGNIYVLNTSNSVSGYDYTGSVFARSVQDLYPFEGYMMSSSMRSVISLDGSARSAVRGSSTATRAGSPGDPRLKQRGIPRIDDK
jgi:hypothetical protein